MDYGIIKDGEILSINLLELHKNSILKMVGEFKHIEPSPKVKIIIHFGFKASINQNRIRSKKKP